jgi:hypothetical protein
MKNYGSPAEVFQIVDLIVPGIHDVIIQVDGSATLFLNEKFERIGCHRAAGNIEYYPVTG